MLNPVDIDADVRAIKDVLELHKCSHPEAQVDSYRQNSGIDPDSNH